MTSRLKKQIAFGLGLAVITFVFLPSHFAQAGVTSLITDPVGTVIQSILGWWFQQIGILISILAKSLNYAIDLRAGGSIPVVAATWKILRDFANMFFIIVLIYVAFATIFDQKNYAFQSMIVRFVIVAILINFSLTLGNLVIDACQVLTNVFLGSIGNLGDRLGTYLNPGALLPGVVGTASLAGGGLISLVFGIILSMIFLFSLLVALTFTFIRVPFIWGLLIVSPIAWMSLILPSSRKWFSMWWSQFRGWNLFLPVYLFFMYIGLIFLSQRDTVIHAVLHFNTANGVDPSTTPIVAGLTNGMTFNLFFFYIFTAVIMIGGTWAATKTTSMMGSGFEKGVGWARTFAGKVTGYDVRAEGAKNAVKDAATQFRQRGFENRTLNRIYGGKEGDIRTEARYGRFLGVDNALEKEVASWKKQMENLDATQLRERMTTGNKGESLAAREMLRGMNQLGKDDLLATYKLYGGDHSAAARKFLTDVDFGKLSKKERQDILKDDQIKDIKVRQKLANTMAEKGDIEDAGQLSGLARELYGTNEIGYREIVDNAKKKRLTVAAETLAALNLTPPQKDLEGKDKAGTHMTADEYLAAQVKNMPLKDIGDQDVGVWKDARFTNALVARLDEAQKKDPRKKGKKGVAPGGGQNLLKSLKGSIKDSNAKLEILAGLESRLKLGDMIDSKDEDAVPEAEDDGGFGGGEPEETPPAAGTVSYKETGVHTANVIDLRNTKD